MNLEDGEDTHEGGVRELVRARDHITGKLSVVFKVEGEGRPLIMEAKLFDVRYKPLVDSGQVFRVNRSYSLTGEGPQWECRSCRQLFAHEADRAQVVNEIESDLGEWCRECVVARVHKPH